MEIPYTIYLIKSNNPEEFQQHLAIFSSHQIGFNINQNDTIYLISNDTSKELGCSTSRCF